MSPLGRGLSALIPTSSGPVPQPIIQKITQEALQQTGERVLFVPTDQIEANPDQPRKNFSRLELEELINSVREHGIIQPLILTPIAGNRYQIVAGERRWRAARILEFKEVPAIVRTMTEIEKFEISLLENVQRQDLNPMERARAYQRLVDEFRFTQDQVAQRIGKARATIANTLRLLTLPESVQQAIEVGRISEGHAKVLLSLEDSQKQEMFLKRILGLGLTVKETEMAIKGQLKSISRPILDPSLLAKEKRLTEALNTLVKIKRSKNKGKIIIHFESDEELTKILDRLISDSDI